MSQAAENVLIREGHLRQAVADRVHQQGTVLPPVLRRNTTGDQTHSEHERRADVNTRQNLLYKFKTVS